MEVKVRFGRGFITKLFPEILLRRPFVSRLEVRLDSSCLKDTDVVLLPGRRRGVGLNLDVINLVIV